MKELVPIDRTLRGDAAGLAVVLRTAHAHGRLITDPAKIRPRPLTSGRYEVRVRMYDEVTVPIRERLRRWDRAHPVASAITKALSFALAVGLLILAAMVAVVLAIAHALSGINLAGLGGAAGLAIILVLVGAGLSGGGDGHGDGWGFHWSKCK